MQQSQEPCSASNDLNQQQIKPSWRRFTNPNNPDPKFAVFRVFGICEEFPQVHWIFLKVLYSLGIGLGICLN